MTRQCTCDGIIRQHQLTGEREAWTCGACGRYGAIARGSSLERKTMTKDEFIDGYCARSGISREELSRRRVAVPCDCGDESCCGWMMISGPDALADALAGPRWTVPSGLTPEQIRQYILDSADGKIPPDSTVSRSPANAAE